MKTFQKGDSAGNFIRVRMNLSNLEAIEKSLLTRLITRVGILGNKANRTAQAKGETHAAYKRRVRKEETHGGGTHTNAEIGLIHEKGSLSYHIPRRSFLEMPLVTKSDQLLNVRNSLLEDFLHSGEHSVADLKMTYKKLGIEAENVVQRAFASGGYGAWPPDSASTIRRKGSSRPLIDTAQLRKSITSDVVSR